MDEKDLSSFSIEDEGRCGDMARKSAAGMNIVPARDLLSQEGMPVTGHGEGSGVLVEDPSDMMPESGRIERQG
jgi:hypothetical protein